MPKNSKLNNLHQTHGKVEKEKLTLDQVWGDTGTGKYGTLDTAEYDDYLNNLNKSDLQAHAIKIGLVPIDDRHTLINRLKKEFKKHIALYSQSKLKKETKISKSVKDILSEGR